MASRGVQLGLAISSFATPVVAFAAVIEIELHTPRTQQPSNVAFFVGAILFAAGLICGLAALIVGPRLGPRIAGAIGVLFTLAMAVVAFFLWAMGGYAPGA